jgi:hypothetical protein
LRKHKDGRPAASHEGAIRICGLTVLLVVVAAAWSTGRVHPARFSTQPKKPCPSRTAGT